MKYFLITLVLFTVFSCKPNKYEKIIHNKRELLKRTENSSIMRRNTMMIYEVSDGDSLDEFFFRDKGLEFKLVNHLRNHKNVSSKIDTVLICKKALAQLNYIEDLEIEGYTQKFKDLGISRKFYLSNYEALLYIPHPDSLEGAYRNYVTKGKLLAKNWYLYHE